MVRLLLIVAAALASGCSPVTMSVTFFADSSTLLETTVDADKNARDAKVVLVDVRGLISEKTEAGLLSVGGASVDDLAAQLKRAQDDTAVKAVILRINSPGGTVTGSDMMYHEVRRFMKESKKPVVASLGEVAASGGYYLALAADRIVAEPTSITGSIGVIMPTINVSEGLGRIGIHSRSVKSGKNKDLANPLEPMRDEQYAVLQGIVDEFYESFKALVVERRTRPATVGTRTLATARLDELTDGRVLTGVRAVDAGLADQTGGVRDAFTVAKSLAGLAGARLVKYYPEGTPRPRSAYAEAGTSPPGERGTEINLVQIRAGRMGTFADAGAYYLWIPPG